MNEAIAIHKGLEKLYLFIYSNRKDNKSFTAIGVI